MIFRKERGLAACGLACALCSVENCPGCAARGCSGSGDCAVLPCAQERGIEGCHACAEFPCAKTAHVRPRAFNRYAREHGVEALQSRLERNQRDGLVYHRADGHKGDYDIPDDEDEILALIEYGISRDPYSSCPTLESKRFALRLVRQDDAEDLLACYGDPRAQRFFNADYCTSDFRYSTLDEMKACIAFWLGEYAERTYVRWSIIDRAAGKAIGTIEMFGDPIEGNRLVSKGTGVFRLDIATAYEDESALSEIIALCTHDFYALFGVDEIIIKAIPEAAQRVAALKAYGYAPYGHHGEQPRVDYYAHHRADR